jgi:formylmethanofuran dehydrogenase subunit D
MGSLSGLLVTVRSAKQGAEMMANKLSAEYAREISSLRIHPDDMHELAVSEGQSVRMASPYGAVTVTCQLADVPRGTFFLPLGPVANQLFSGANTDGTGVPDWKRQPVTLQACEAPTPNLATQAKSSDGHQPATSKARVAGRASKSTATWCVRSAGVFVTISTLKCMTTRLFRSRKPA